MGAMRIEEPSDRVDLACPAESFEELSLRFTALYRRYWPDVHRFCSRLVRDPARAEDLAQETFLRAFRQLPTLQEARGVWPWLSTIARNVCIDQIRVDGIRTAATARAASLEVDRGDNTWEEVARRYKRRRLAGQIAWAIDCLPPRERRILQKKMLEERSWAEIARLDGSTPDTVRNLAWRARRALRPLLSDAKSESLGLGIIPAFWLRSRSRLQRARIAIAQRLEVVRASVVPSLYEQAASIIVGVALVSTVLVVPEAEAFLFGQKSQPIHGAAAAGEVIDRRDPDQARRPLIFSFTQATGSPIVHSSIATAPPASRAVAPSSGVIIVEASMPNGSPIVHVQYEYRCDEQGVDLFPDNGPVRRAC
jgi:RNA polymerase sigma-70 factor (ECF subfamily)